MILQGGTRVDCYVRDNQLATSSRLNTQAQAKNDFEAAKDVVFIPNYVFEHCENKDATLYYVPENGCPSSLLLVECVGIHASALSVPRKQEDKFQNSERKDFSAQELGDIVWGKQLRFIMRNFPSVQIILVTATSILDMYRPKSCPLPYQLFHQIEAINALDRAKLGILDEEVQTQTCPMTAHDTDFVLKAWDEIKAEWPCYKENRVKYKLGPRLGIAGLIFFAKEWVHMERDGEHGRSCRIMDNKLPMGPIREAVKLERAARDAPRGASRGKAKSCLKQ